LPPLGLLQPLPPLLPPLLAPLSLEPLPLTPLPLLLGVASPTNKRAAAQAIFSEATRAAAAEETNAQAILDETTRAEGAEGSLGQRITDDIADEVIRASGEEAALVQLILGEKTRAEGEEATNAQAILDEQTRAEGAEETLTTETERLANQQNQLIGHNIHYGFRVCGTTSQNCNSGNILVFNENTRTDFGCHVVPDATAYNISTYKYTVPIDGYYFWL